MSPIYLSATSIQDFMECPNRFRLRTSRKEESIPNDDMLVGTIVHHAIEKYWNNREIAFTEMNSQLEFFKLPTSKFEKANYSLDMFFHSFAGQLSEEDKIEYQFKLQLEKDVFLVGKIDRISNGNLFDWKTTTTPPRDISTDIQFLVYQEAYRRLFGKEPIAVYYASLSTGKLIKLTKNPSLTRILFSDIIPSVTQAIRQKNFYPRGIFTGSCRFCSYKELCYEESNYELVSSNLTKR